MSKTIFDGNVIGKVIRPPLSISIHGYAITSFVIQLIEKIDGVPSEIPVYLAKTGINSYKLLLTANKSEGDIVQINGKIYETPIKFWNKEGIWMEAKHLYNKNINFGY
ncbi:MAG: hypothetical protein ACFFAH_06750 [Promethearchaeota archaeon]